MTTPEVPRAFITSVHEALQLWHTEPASGSPLRDLALVQQQLATGMNIRRATNEVLLSALNALTVEHAEEVTLLRDRFLDGKTVFTAANERNVAEVTLYKMQRRAMALLAQTLYAQEQHALADRLGALVNRLPPATYEHLLGAEGHLQHLSDVLLAPGTPRLVAVEGLGGIGKTAIAHQLVIRLAQHQGGFTDFGWITVRQPTLQLDGETPSVQVDTPALSIPVLIEALVGQLLGTGIVMLGGQDRALGALEARLHRTPHLIVIDNLETINDVASLVPTLARLAGPSKFLLTSRESLYEVSAIYHFPVPELGEADALRLVRMEARLRNLPHVAGADDSELRPLYETVGGNPLALRLVTGQLHLLSLPQVVENLRQARGKKAEELYRYIYWNAWQRLPTAAQDTLMLMPLFAGDGADLTAISRVSDLADDALLEALEYLVELCLVSVNGDLQACRYSIHRLTESFLLKEVIKWRTADPLSA